MSKVPISFSNQLAARLDKLLNNLAQDFTIDKLSVSPARFNLKKLEWFNSEYIKMLSLMEYAYRADKLKLDKRYKDKNLRIGDYVYLVDLEKQMVFGEIWDEAWPDTDGFFYPLGGGRDQNESSIDCVCRETLEESQGQLHIQPGNLLKIVTRQHEFEEPKTFGGETWDGKEYNIYFCPIKYEDVKACQGDGAAKCDWISLDKVIAANQHLTFPIWYNFCQENKLECFEPREQILQKLLSYRLDQNRITTLDQIGSESECIWNYQACPIEILKWKKITLEQSLENLKELYEKFVGNSQIWEEFYLYIANLKFKMSFEGKNLRPGAYCLLVDFEKQLILVEGKSGLLGGGIEPGENPIQACIREISEETEGQIQLNVSNIIELGKTEFLKDFANFEGKEMDIFVSEASERDFSEIPKSETSKGVRWIAFGEFFKHNTHIPWPIWSQFCLQNNFQETNILNKHQSILSNFYRNNLLETYLDQSTIWWENKIKEYLVSENRDFGEYLWPLRIVLSGKSKSPSAFEIMVIIGQIESVRRIKEYLD